MKVNANKADASAQMAKSDSASNAAANQTGDEFSDLISSMLSVTSNQRVPEDEEVEVEVKDKTQDADEKDDQASSISTIMNPQSPQIVVPADANTAANNKENLNDTLQQQQDDLIKVALTVNQDKNDQAKIKLANMLNQISLEQQNANDLAKSNQTPEIKRAQAIFQMQNQANETDLSVPSLIQELQQIQQQKTLKNQLQQAQNKTLNNPNNKSVAASLMEHVFNKSVSSMLNTNKIETENNVVTSAQNFRSEQTLNPSSTTATVFNIQQGQVYSADNRKNKYIDALVQMGNMINSHTAVLDHNTLSATSEQKLTTPSYTDTLNNLQQPNYDIRIEFTPQSLESLMLDTYNANIKIHPAELGSVMAKLKMDKNKTELVLTAETSRVKEIIEANLPQLRQSFKDSDINLTNITVNVQTANSESAGQQQKQQQQSSSEVRDNQSELAAKNNISTTSKTVTKKLNGLVDTYA